MNRKRKVLFFSTGDATRSQMAEGFFRTFAGDDFVAVSTATESAGRNPMAVEVMEEIGVDIADQHAKDVAQSLKEHFACVVTVCDEPRERSPVWPFTPNIFHWSLLDPAKVTGSPEQRREVFRTVRDEIGRKVKEFVDQTLPRFHTPTAAAR